MVAVLGSSADWFGQDVSRTLGFGTGAFDTGSSVILVKGPQLQEHGAELCEIASPSHVGRCFLENRYNPAESHRYCDQRLAIVSIIEYCSFIYKVVIPVSIYQTILQISHSNRNSVSGVSSA